MHLLLIVISVFLFFTTDAFVKIDVSKLSTTTTPAVLNDSTTVTTLTTTQPNATTAITTTTPMPTATVPTNATVNGTLNTELNQTIANGTLPSLGDHVPRTSRVKVSPDHYYCKCDLMVNFCDINCCCDNDCTDEMLSVFVCDEKHWSIHDYEYDAGLTPCEIKGGWLCVVAKDTVPETTKYDVGLFDERSKYKWPEMFASQESGDESRESYKSGDSVLAFDDKTEEIGAFVFPYTLTGDYCHTNVPIKYLDDFESKCLRSYEQMRTFLDEFSLKLKSTKILQLRKINHAMMSEHCTGANKHCMDIKMIDCFGLVSRDNCVEFNSTEIDDTRWLNREIVIQFRHNFTNILNCTAYLIYSGVDVMPDTLVHSVKIQFLQVNESMAANIHRISGNIGYMQGKPIVTAKMIPLNVSNVDENLPKILDYFHPNKTFSNDDHFMKIPAIRKNFCMLTNLTYDIIRFGENLFLTCDVALDDNLNVTVESNFTEVCTKLQRKIFAFMLNEYQESNDTTAEICLAMKISEYGNPKNDSLYWTNANLKHGIVDVVQSKYEPDDNASEFICQNMILSLSYEFLYASLSVGSFKHQNLIKTVDVIFGTRVDLKFNLNEPIKVPIFLDVMFVDLTNSAESYVNRLNWILILIGLVNVL